MLVQSMKFFEMRMDREKITKGMTCLVCVCVSSSYYIIETLNEAKIYCLMTSIFNFSRSFVMN